MAKAAGGNGQAAVYTKCPNEWEYTRNYMHVPCVMYRVPWSDEEGTIFHELLVLLVQLSM